MKIVLNKIRTFSPKAHWREVLAVVMILLAYVFFRTQRKELSAIAPHLRDANNYWLTAGVLLTSVYIMAQAGMYRSSFAALGLKLKWVNGAVLFLKRNLISIFLPAGGVSALAYTPSQIRKSGYTQMQIHRASGLFGFAGLVTVFLAGVPVIIYTFVTSGEIYNSIGGLAALFGLIAVLLAAARSFQAKGRLFQWVDKKFPAVAPFINELFAADVNVKKFSGTIAYSLGVELCGMLHIYIAMKAFGLPASLGAAAAAYIIAVLMMVISPFLRGLGAVEISMVFVLEKYGYTATQAFSITILYRVFEFWLPLLAGIFSFAWKGRQLFLRVFPALLTFILGFVNVISVVTPPLLGRLHSLKAYVPLATIQASNLLVLFIGLSLIVTAAFLFRGLRSAWLVALTLSIVSVVGHLVKALDYEEAIVAAVNVAVLVATASQYRISNSNRWMLSALKTSLISFVAVLLFTFTSFYFIDKKHFGSEFNWQQAFTHVFRSLLLLEDDSLHPVTKFGTEFLLLIKTLGFLNWTFFLVSLFKRTRKNKVEAPTEHERAESLLNRFGNSPMDYFKICNDKLLFFSEIHEAFVAYRISGGFAIVLEEPVCAPENKVDVLQEFEHHCRRMGLRPAFYRVDEGSIHWFNQLKKHKILIGQEAILDTSTFTLEGKDKKSLRNGLNSLQKKGFSVNLSMAPHSDVFVASLKRVSDEWLESFDKQELVFSQGMFQAEELKNQDIISIVDDAGNVKAFLNIIPNYAEDECTYDLIRKTIDAPAAAMDALIIRLIEYAKAKGHNFINLGLVPMTGITQPDNTAERILKLAALRIKKFQHYRGLREFKDKYATLWENKYLVYNSDFDLMQLPVAINTVMKPISRSKRVL